MSAERAIRDCFISEDVASLNGHDGNVVDVLASIGGSLKRLGDAITPNIGGGPDPNGGHVESLTEAVMGVTGGLCRIADALESIAEAIKDHQ